jgi:hypothetical protein
MSTFSIKNCRQTTIKKKPSIVQTKVFRQFSSSQICKDLVIASIYFISSDQALKTLELIDDQKSEQEQELTRENSKKSISSLYCQLLLSPTSSNLSVREERIFYETLIYFLGTCVSDSLPQIKFDLIFH